MGPKRNPKREATALLDVWRAITGVPYLVLPIDPTRIARRLGIDVFAAEVDPSVSAMLVKTPGNDPVIILNQEDSPNRQRFSCAHEIGHFVANQDNPDKYERVDYRGPLAATGADPEEVFANQFAAELIMPAEAVRELKKNGMTTTGLAARFQVSQEAMKYRLENLKL